MKVTSIIRIELGDQVVELSPEQAKEAINRLQHAVGAIQPKELNMEDIRDLHRQPPVDIYRGHPFVQHHPVWSRDYSLEPPKITCMSFQ